MALERFQQTASVVERHDQQIALFAAHLIGQLQEDIPGLQCLVKASQLFQRCAQVKACLQELRLEFESFAIVVFCSGQISGVGVQDGQVEEDSMG
ncbi:hypothetical protein D3C75_1141380 [compost metagenome]